MANGLVITFLFLGSSMTAAASPDLTARAAAPGLHRFGVTVDVGVPDGANTAVVLRPIRALRLHAGLGHNGISRGLRAGATFVPLSTWLSPTLSIDVGQYAEGDANPAIRFASGDSTFHDPMLERVGYRYGNAHVGLELGNERATFYLHAGYSRITGNIHGLDTSPNDEPSMLTLTESPAVTVWSVSARAGLIIYIL